MTDNATPQPAADSDIDLTHYKCPQCPAYWGVHHGSQCPQCASVGRPVTMDQLQEVLNAAASERARKIAERIRGI